MPQDRVGPQLAPGGPSWSQRIPGSPSRGNRVKARNVFAKARKTRSQARNQIRPQMRPKCGPRRPQIQPKRAPRQDAPKMAHNKAKKNTFFLIAPAARNMTARGPQMVSLLPRWPQDGRSLFEEGPKRAQEVRQTFPRRAKKALKWPKAGLRKQKKVPKVFYWPANVAGPD